LDNELEIDQYFSFLYLMLSVCLTATRDLSYQHYLTCIFDSASYFEKSRVRVRVRVMIRVRVEKENLTPKPRLINTNRDFFEEVIGQQHLAYYVSEIQCQLQIHIGHKNHISQLFTILK